MSIWLQKRLAVWMGVALCGGALLWNVGALRAQSIWKMRRVKLTRDEAVKNFISYLQLFQRKPVNFYAADAASINAWTSSVARKSDNKVLPHLMAKMATQWTPLSQKFRVKSENTQAAKVVVGISSKNERLLFLIKAVPESVVARA